jgi:RNA polymerase sigma-70 factor (ECF subfamily)
MFSRSWAGDSGPHDEAEDREMTELRSIDLLALRVWAARVIERGRSAWPALSVSEDQLIRIVTLRYAEYPPQAATLDLDGLDPVELYLVAACEQGDIAGLRELYRRYFTPVASSLGRMGIDADQCADVWQVLCERLLVGQDGALPRVVRYAGQGKLQGLIRVAAIRVALNWLSQDKRHTSDDDWLNQLPAAGSDPELRTIKERHSAEFKHELEAALAELSARERMILRLHLLEQRGIDAIASLCSVHRATAARMVARTKERLSSELRARLARRWGLNDAFDLKAVIDSQLDLSLPRLLGA